MSDSGYGAVGADRSGDADLRDAAVKRIKARASFWNSLLVGVVVIVIVNAIWAITGMRYYWPMWVELAVGVGLLFHALDTFGPGKRWHSEDAVQREMNRMRGQG